MIGWTEEEKETLFKLRNEGKKWQEVAAHFPAVGTSPMFRPAFDDLEVALVRIESFPVH